MFLKHVDFHFFLDIIFILFWKWLSNCSVSWPQGDFFAALPAHVNDAGAAWWPAVFLRGANGSPVISDRSRVSPRAAGARHILVSFQMLSPIREVRRFEGWRGGEVEGEAVRRREEAGDVCAAFHSWGASSASCDCSAYLTGHLKVGELQSGMLPSTTPPRIFSFFYPPLQNIHVSLARVLN